MTENERPWWMGDDDGGEYGVVSNGDAATRRHPSPMRIHHIPLDPTLAQRGRPTAADIHPASRRKAAARRGALGGVGEEVGEEGRHPAVAQRGQRWRKLRAYLRDGQ